MIQFTVYGEPVGQQRVGRRHFVSGGRAMSQAYDPEKSKNFKTCVALTANQVRPPKPLEGPVKVVIMAYKSIPKSFSKKKRQAALEGRLIPITKPDNDNIYKGVTDALKSIMWHDDSQIALSIIGKLYTDVPRVEVTIEPMGVSE